MKTVRGGWVCGLALMLGTLAACASPATPTQAPTLPTAAPTTAPVVAPTATEAAPPAATQAAEPTAAPIPTETPVPALKVTGLVTSALGWSTAQLKAMPATSASGQNNKGETDTYSGVLLADLITLAAPQADAKSVVFLGDGGAQLELALADVLACADCIASFRNQGGLSLLVPFYSPQLALRGLTEIQIK